MNDENIQINFKASTDEIARISRDGSVTLFRKVIEDMAAQFDIKAPEQWRGVAYLLKALMDGKAEIK